MRRLGIYAADRLSAGMAGVIFRAQRDGGTGLNAHLEIVADDMTRVVGLKICNDSECERTARGYVCNGGTETAAYWLQHSLPVVVMVYEQSGQNGHRHDKIMWEAVTPDNIDVDGPRWELTVPYEQVYDEEAAKRISNLTCTSPYLARLALDRPWIELISEGREIFLEMDEWINQPSARGMLRLCVNGPEGGIYQWPFQASPDMPHILRLPSLFPWASLFIDEDFYREKNARDPEPGLLTPWTVEAGEIARFRLRLALNELGRAFLLAEPFICRGKFPELQRVTGFGQDYESGLKFQLFKKS